MHWVVRTLPGAFLAAFGFGVLIWLGQQALHSILLIPVTVGILGLVYAMVPERRFGKVALLMGYAIGAAVAGFLLFGILTGPIGGDPGEVAAFIDVALTMLVLYALSILSGLIVAVWPRLTRVRSRSSQ